MDIIPPLQVFKDPGEFQLWIGIINNAVHRVDIDTAIAEGDKAVRAARARIPIIVEPVKTKQ